MSLFKVNRRLGFIIIDEEDNQADAIVLFGDDVSTNDKVSLAGRSLNLLQDHPEDPDKSIPVDRDEYKDSVFDCVCTWDNDELRAKLLKKGRTEDQLPSRRFILRIVDIRDAQ